MFYIKLVKSGLVWGSPQFKHADPCTTSYGCSWYTPHSYNVLCLPVVDGIVSLVYSTPWKDCYSASALGCNMQHVLLYKVCCAAWHLSSLWWYSFRPFTYCATKASTVHSPDANFS